MNNIIIIFCLLFPVLCVAKVPPLEMRSSFSSDEMAMNLLLTKYWCNNGEIPNDFTQLYVDLDDYPESQHDRIKLLKSEIVNYFSDAKFEVDGKELWIKFITDGVVERGLKIPCF